MNANVLPVVEFRDRIVDSVDKNSVTLVVADTGAGKSTQVPQFLLDAGYQVVVTQPRRLAARSLAERVAEETKTKLGQLIGYQTAHEKLYSKATRCMFVTDGLQLINELMLGSARDNIKRVLIIDEVHEWNLNIELLIAWVRQKLAGHVHFKVVLMSATINADMLSSFFWHAPVIRVPGRLFPIEEQNPEGDIVADAIRLARQGRNVLVFQPGKAEINKTIDEIQNATGNRFKVLPLHGELDSAEQRLCFQHYGRPKIVVSTNVAQTSVTIDDIDAVVDSGVERRVELVNGVEGLYLKSISRADAKQRAGRAGRTKPGIYIDHCSEDPEFRAPFPKAEIELVRLDQTVLRLAEMNFDMEELRFFHQPDIGAIRQAKVTLKKLGCMNPNGTVTEIGKKVARLPVSVTHGRMVVEADRLGVVKDIVTIAAILEVGQLNARKLEDGRENKLWLDYIREETDSDLIAQLHLFEAASQMNRDEMKQAGIHVGAYYKVKDARNNLEKALRKLVRDVESEGSREALLKAICAGMVNTLYAKSVMYYIGGENNDHRQLAKESVVEALFAPFVMGIPFDLEIQGRYGEKKVLPLLRMVTKVNLRMLEEAAPQLLDARKTQWSFYRPEQGMVMTTWEKLFNGVVVGTEEREDPDHPDMARYKLEAIYEAFEPQPRYPVSIHEMSEADLELKTEKIGVHPVTGEDINMYFSFRLWTPGYFRPTWVRIREEAESNQARARREYENHRARLSRAAATQKNHREDKHHEEALQTSATADNNVLRSKLLALQAQFNSR